jgi:hypothetical protein
VAAQRRLLAGRLAGDGDRRSRGGLTVWAQLRWGLKKAFAMKPMNLSLGLAESRPTTSLQV